MTCIWCGRDTGCDCIERMNCPKAGEIGHMCCGVRECGCPKFLACEHILFEDDENMPELQCIHGEYGLCEKCNG